MGALRCEASYPTGAAPGLPWDQRAGEVLTWKRVVWRKKKKEGVERDSTRTRGWRETEKIN